MQQSIIKEKSYSFAIKIVSCYKGLTQDKKEFVLSKQLLRSGTSIGANVEEALGGQSTKDFYSKLTIAYKEARESRYWINLLRDCDYLQNKDTIALLNDCDEILRIIGSIQSTVKKKLQTRNC